MSASNCRRCGTSLRFVERTAEKTPTDHHNHVYECPNCEREVVAG